MLMMRAVKGHDFVDIGIRKNFDSLTLLNRIHTRILGWERRGSHEYYYRKERDGSRVKSTYVGRGEMAQLTAVFLAMQREKGRLDNQKLKQEQAVLEALIWTIKQWSEL